MTKLQDFICQTYTFTKAGDIKPTADGNSFTLQIRESKYFGRPKYLQIRITGNARPVFVSSIYEPRTAGGIFNIEINKKRYEATRTDDDGLTIQPLPYRVKQEARLHREAKSALNNNSTFVSEFETTLWIYVTPY